MSNPPSRPCQKSDVMPPGSHNLHKNCWTDLKRKRHNRKHWQKRMLQLFSIRAAGQWSRTEWTKNKEQPWKPLCLIEGVLKHNETWLYLCTQQKGAWQVPLLNVMRDSEVHIKHTQTPAALYSSLAQTEWESERGDRGLTLFLPLNSKTGSAAEGFKPESWRQRDVIGAAK